MASDQRQPHNAPDFRAEWIVGSSGLTGAVDCRE